MTEVEDQYHEPAPEKEQTSPIPLRKQGSFDGTKTTPIKPLQPPRPQFVRAKTISLPTDRQMDKVASETQDERKYHSLKRNGPIKPWAELLQPSNESDQFPDGEVSEPPIIDAPDSHILTHSPSPTNTDTTESESASEDNLTPTPSASPTSSTSPGKSHSDIKSNSPPEEETPLSPPPSVVGNNETNKSSGPPTSPTQPPTSPTQPPNSPTQPPNSPTKSPTSPTAPAPAMKLPPRPYPPSQARYLEARLKKKRPPPPGPRIIDTRSTPAAKPTPTTDSSPSPTGNESRKLQIIQAEVSSFSSIPKRPPPPSNTPHTTPTPAQPKEDEPIAILKATHRPPPSSSDDPVKPRGILKKNNTTPILSTTAKVDFAEETESIDELQPLPNLDSPRDDKKLVSKMKSSFRNFTHRKKHGRENVPSPPSSRRTISGSRPASKHSPVYDQKRYPAKLPVGIISPLVVQCVAYLNRPESLNEPGLFRIPGDMSVMKKYRASFARGEEVDLSSDCHDPHTVAGLLKLHFREQRQCLIPGDALMEKIVVAVREKDVDEFRALVETVDTKAQAGIRMVAELLKKIAENSEVNHMTSGTLATSCGPSFFPRLGPSSANAVLKFLADNCDAIFST